MTSILDLWARIVEFYYNGEGILASLFHISLVLLLAFLLVRYARKGTRRWMRRFEDLPVIDPRRQRAFTVSGLITSATKYIVWPLVIIVILGEINIDVTALIATAGIAGLAIGFGAQTLVKDFISGIFLLFDDTIHVGDFVKFGADEGTVEFIGIRLIKVRKFNGELLMIPAGELRVFSNRSIDYARMIVDVNLPYEQDIDQALQIMERVAQTWAEENKDILLEEKPLVQAITTFAESAITARVVVQVVPGNQWQAERDLRLMLKRAFDLEGIEAPFPRRTLYMHQDPSEDSASADT